MQRRLSLLATVAAAVALSVWFQIWSLDGLQGAILSAFLRQDTAYANGYTDRAFRMVRVGMTDAQVWNLLGPPLGMTFSYLGSRPHGCTSVHFKDGKARSWVFDECETLGIRIGLPMREATALLGTPDEVYWLYSESPGDTHYRERVIRLSNGAVLSVIRGWYLD